MSPKAQGQRKVRAPASGVDAADPFRLVAEYAPVMMWLADCDGRSVYSNPRWLRFCGHTLEEGLGLAWLESAHPDDRGRCRDTQTASLASRESFEVACRLRRADGEHRRVRVYGAPVIDGDRLAGFVGSCVDMTDAIGAQDQLLANVSHELRSPLNAIKSWAHVIENQLYEMDDPTTRRAIDGILVGVDEQVRIIGGLLAPKGEEEARTAAPRASARGADPLIR